MIKPQAHTLLQAVELMLGGRSSLTSDEGVLLWHVRAYLNGMAEASDQTEEAADATGPNMALLPLDDSKRSLSSSALPSSMIWAGGEAYDALIADQALDLDSCALAVGIYRAMTKAHADELAALASAVSPNTPEHQP